MTAKVRAQDSPSTTGIKRINVHAEPQPQQQEQGKKQQQPDKKKETRSPSPASKYGYGDAAPDDKSKYGYGDAAPSLSSNTSNNKATRRSSMKQAGAPSRRRASIHMCEEIEVKVLGYKEPVRRRTSITFSTSVRVKPVVPVQEMADVSPETLWFQDDEYDRMKEKSWTIVDKELASKKYGGVSTNYCTRGLERMMKPHEVQQKKYKCWDTVLGEQNLQRQSCLFDDEYMANMYKFITAESQQEAERRAQQDEAEIQNYMRSTRKSVRRMTMV